MFTVYALCNPDGEPRYVGVTSLPLNVRFASHMREGGRIARWAQKLYESGKAPRVEALQTLDGLTKPEAIHIIEDAWIVRLLSDGACLMNERINTYFGHEEYAS